MIRLRDAGPADVPVILALVRELALFEREPDKVLATEEDFLRDGFGDTPRFFVRLAEVDGETAGFSLAFHAWSTWEGRAVLHLEDLFVRERFRRLGVGTALLQDLAFRAKKDGCTRFEWNVLDWNENAIRFYESFGATILTGWRVVRLEGAALDRFATAR